MAVGGDQVYRFERDAELFAGGDGGVGKELAEAEIELADFGRGEGSAFGDFEDFGANGFGDGEGGMAFEFGF